MIQRLAIIILWLLQYFLPFCYAVGSPFTPPDIDFSQFEDIVELLHSDSSPNQQDKQHESVKKEKKKYIRTKETNKRRWKTEKLRMEADVEFEKKRKAQKCEAAKRCRIKNKTRLTEEEKERQRIKINERARKSYALAKKRPGGFYGSAENKKIQMLLQKMKDGLASEEDLKIITDHRAKRNEAVKRSRNKKRKEE